MRLLNNNDLYNDVTNVLDEEKDYAKYLLKKAIELPDVWQPREKKHESEEVRTIYFKNRQTMKTSDIESIASIRNYLKAYAYQLFYFRGNGPETIGKKISSIKKIFKDYVTSEYDVNTNFKDAFIKQISDFKQDIKDTAISGSTCDRKKTRLQYATNVYDFFQFLELYSRANTWINQFDLQKELPKKLVKYFDKEELATLDLELYRQNKKNKTPALSWTTTYELAKFIDNFEGFNYGLMAIVIALEGGLRISEIRELRRDCLKPILREEEEMVARYFKRQGNAPRELDYSESMWLTYYVVKGKQGEPTEGTPILVGKRVINAINRVLKATEELTEMSGSDMLFLNRSAGGKGKVTVRSYASFWNDLQQLYEMGMPLVRLHQCRATFSTILYFLGIPIGVIEKYLNHVSSEVTAGYVDATETQSSNTMSWMLQNRVDENAEEKLKALHKELLYLVGTQTFIGLTHNSRLKLFERLQQRFGVKLKISDHGVCVLPEDEVCEHGFDNALPCHASGCTKFNPDTDEESETFFEALLSNNKSRIKELEELVNTNSGIKVNFNILNLETNTLEAILETVRKAS